MATCRSSREEDGEETDADVLRRELHEELSVEVVRAVQVHVRLRACKALAATAIATAIAIAIATSAGIAAATSATVAAAVTAALAHTPLAATTLAALPLAMAALDGRS